MNKVIDHLRACDPVIASAIRELPQLRPSSRHDYFASLCEIIIQQQLSERAGDIIYARFKNLFPNKRVTPEQLMKIADPKIRKAGISWIKVKYMKNVATAVLKKKLDFRKLESLSDNEVIEQLTKIKGVGNWTAEMFLMFTLGREDVFSYGDLGLRRAIKKLYSLKTEPTVTEALKISAKWRPYRSYGCLILWRSA